MKVHRYPITDTLFRFGITLSIFLSGYIVTGNCTDLETHMAANALP